jgi:ABC-2 type transport system ATP-binding protein
MLAGAARTAIPLRVAVRLQTISGVREARMPGRQVLPDRLWRTLEKRRMSTVVTLDRISKAYEQKIAVKDLSLQIDEGIMFGLLGPNGSGKTSTIRMMIGITMPDSGSVNLFGKPFTRDGLKRVGYLPEERGLYKKMKVMDQLVFMGELRGLDPAVAGRRAHDWCERMQILEAVGKKTEELSKGMQQKIQFIATLLHDPELVIMDEPFSGLDPVNATLLQDTLIELRKAGKAILFSTHRMDQVEKLCDSICLIDRGHAVLQGGMREVKSRYERNHVVMTYEGDSSFLRHPAIAGYKDYAGQVEIQLKPGANAQDLLREAVQKATITKFELVEPSLEEIFIRTVGEKVDA